MNNAADNRETARQDAKRLLDRIGIGRILIVDDEYATDVGELLGMCEELGSARTAALPHLQRVGPEDPADVRNGAIREVWDELNRAQRRELLARAREAHAAETGAHVDNGDVEDSVTGADSGTVENLAVGPDRDPDEDSAAGADGGSEESPAEGADTGPAVGADSESDESPVSADDSGPEEDLAAGDDKAASSLDDLLADLEGLEFVPLSLGDWEEQREGFLTDDRAAETLVLFDRDFRGEGADENEGLRHIQDLQRKDIGFFGMVSHTVQLGDEYEAWRRLSAEHGLNRDRFVVIAKDRLKVELPDYHGFLAMVRLAALSGRYARVKNGAWAIFANSVSEAESRMERLSVLDFDRMVFASSRDESVWEPDTLLRVFGILMRREARSRLHADEEFMSEVETARGVSAAPIRVVNGLKQEEGSNEALEVQRFEIYDSGTELNQFRVPIELGDIFCIGPDGKLCMLLAQPCDLVVRDGGKRNHETSKLQRMVAVAELVRDQDEKRESWGLLPFYEEATGKPAFVNFGKVHQVPLAVLDLCVLSGDGSAAIDVEGRAPPVLVEPWTARHKRLRRIFGAAAKTHEELTERGIGGDEARLALPGWWNTLALEPAVVGKTVQYTVQRTIRLRQPWSGALLTEFAQYQARAAFEHDFWESAEAGPETNGGADPANQRTG